MSQRPLKPQRGQLSSSASGTSARVRTGRPYQRESWSSHTYTDLAIRTTLLIQSASRLKASGSGPCSPQPALPGPNSRTGGGPGGPPRRTSISWSTSRAVCSPASSSSGSRSAQFSNIQRSCPARLRGLARMGARSRAKRVRPAEPGGSSVSRCRSRSVTKGRYPTRRRSSASSNRGSDPRRRDWWCSGTGGWPPGSRRPGPGPRPPPARKACGVPPPGRTSVGGKRVDEGVQHPGHLVRAQALAGPLPAAAQAAGILHRRSSGGPASASTPLTVRRASSSSAGTAAVPSRRVARRRRARGGSPPAVPTASATAKRSQAASARGMPSRKYVSCAGAADCMEGRTPFLLDRCGRMLPLSDGRHKTQGSETSGPRPGAHTK